jgi:hypothetical protein
LNFAHLGQNQNQQEIIFSINPNLEKSSGLHEFKSNVIYQDFSLKATMYEGAH